MPLTKEEIAQIATRTADEVMDQISLEREERELRDHIIGGAMGEGAIPLYGRETRKEPCSGCRIDLDKSLEPGNVMVTTKGAIGTLGTREVRDWCSEIIEVADGRCERARTIGEAARECKEKHPDDTEAFFKCYIPAFSQATAPEHSRDTMFFNVPEARQQLISKGFVYTLRPKMRKTGKDTAFYGSFYKKEKIGDIFVDLIKEVKDPEEVKQYVSDSGFKTLEDWLEAAKGSRFLFKVMLKGSD